MAREQSQGKCYLCQGTFPKGSMTRHLARCLKAHEPTKEGAGAKAEKDNLFHLVVEGKYLPQYWLHLEMPAKTKLGSLDAVLRHLWVECCDHLSAFKIEGKKRQARPSLASLLAAAPMDWSDEWTDPDEVDMEKKVGDLFTKGMKLSVRRALMEWTNEQEVQ